MRHRTWISWSSGKDCAWALWKLLGDPEHEVIGLLTTVSEPQGRVAMHEVRPELVAAQARAVGLPLVEVVLPSPCPNDRYEQAMRSACAMARAAGVTRIAFGDLFLEEVRRYRVERLAGSGLEPVFPLWGRDTRELALEMIAGGLEAWISCVDSRALDRSFAGRRFDEELLAVLPAEVDPCGERGEFHTFVCAGPMMRSRIDLRRGAVAEREGFVHADLLFA